VPEPVGQPRLHELEYAREMVFLWEAILDRLDELCLGKAEGDDREAQCVSDRGALATVSRADSGAAIPTLSAETAS
jgi:hypothetical protein